jgi:hypothetical protein
MYIDFAGLNRHCPKDSYPLPHINQVIDSTTAYELLYFLDVYSGYHRIIWMKVEDQEKTAFITPFALQHHHVIQLEECRSHVPAMHAELPRQQDKPQHGSLFDDVVIKTKRKDDLIADLNETFTNLRCFQMKLNPEKCVFGVLAGKLLGFLVSKRGIDANSEKIKAIANMAPPRSLWNVQKITGSLAILCSSDSQLGEKSMPLYRLLKKTWHFAWTQEAQDGLDQLKRLLTTAPALVAPAQAEPLL